MEKIACFLATVPDPILCAIQSPGNAAANRALEAITVIKSAWPAHSAQIASSNAIATIILPATH